MYSHISTRITGAFDSFGLISVEVLLKKYNKQIWNGQELKTVVFKVY